MDASGCIDSNLAKGKLITALTKTSSAPLSLLSSKNEWTEWVPGNGLAGNCQCGIFVLFYSFTAQGVCVKHENEISGIFLFARSKSK